MCNRCVKKLVKNSQPFGKKVRKPQGGFFDSHCIHVTVVVLAVNCLTILLKYTTEFAPKRAISSEKAPKFYGERAQPSPDPSLSGEEVWEGDTRYTL